ncbi:MAG: GtrA family protein [Chloroflexi bacterium]|nr:MAG: GtrA family protein [Chloroflexota bacterium]
MRESLSSAIPLTGRKRIEAKRFVKFAMVGAAGAVTDFAILNILIQLAGFQEWQANAVSFIVAVIQNFFLNRRWTFPESQNRHAGKQLGQFALVSLIGLAINMAVFLTIHHGFEAQWIAFVGNEHLGFTLSYNVAKLLAIGVVLFWNFAANRLWTYKGL